MARASTSPAAPPKAWIKRPRINSSIEVARKQKIDPAIVITNPSSIITLRPYLSDNGPYISVPIAIANIERLRVS